MPRFIPTPAPPNQPPQDADLSFATQARGLAVLQSPMLNKGSAFTAEERKELGLIGLIPPEITTLATQTKRAYIQYDRLPDARGKKVYLTALQASNEVLFYTLLSEHLREMIPVLHELTAGVTMDQFHHDCRRARGVYLSIDQPEAIEETFANLGAGSAGIDLILATDAEQIPDGGDCGVGGLEVSIGKLAVYTAAGGIDPSRVIAVMLDVGTNCESLLQDPTYTGNRHPRIRGERYDAFIDAYVAAVTKLFPHAVLQWEDFAPASARRILETYRDRICTFNDDIQGTGAIALAAAVSAVRVSGTPLRSQRIVIFGAGTAGIGIADQIRDAMVHEGLSTAGAAARFWCVDREGLLTTDMSDRLRDYQVAYARDGSENWNRNSDGSGASLADVVRSVRPTMLIGASSATASFTEEIVKEMAAHTERPILFVLSNPQARVEATPAELITWTNGRALIAAGHPFSPVTYRGVTYAVAQLNHAMLYPGLALGAIVSRAARISKGMLAAAACAVSSLVTVRQPGASLLPHIDDLRSVASTVAAAVAEAAVAEGLSRVAIPDIVQSVDDAMWQPVYRRLRAS